MSSAAFEAENLGGILDRQERQAAPLVHDMQHAQVSQAQLAVHAHGRQRRRAPRADDEFLDEVGVGELHGIEQIAALERDIGTLQILDREFTGGGDPQGIRIDQQGRQRQPFDQAHPQFLAALRLGCAP